MTATGTTDLKVFVCLRDSFGDTHADTLDVELIPINSGMPHAEADKENRANILARALDFADRLGIDAEDVTALVGIVRASDAGAARLMRWGLNSKTLAPYIMIVGRVHFAARAWVDAVNA